jgi:hypothetical protein
MIDTVVCYLCGEPVSEDRSDDHVPPEALFAPEIRKRFNFARLATLPTHGTCNRRYSLDEEFFVATLALIAEGSPTATAVIRQHAAKLRAGKARALGFKILKQFEERPSGLYLPSGLVAMRLEGDRISRVAWKIVRGLYRIETGDILWEDTPYHLELIEPENRDQARSEKLWEAVKAQPSKGRYGAVFDYKYLDARAGDVRLHLWGMLLWDKIMIFLSHRDPVSMKCQLPHNQ